MALLPSGYRALVPCLPVAGIDPPQNQVDRTCTAMPGMGRTDRGDAAGVAPCRQPVEELRLREAPRQGHQGGEPDEGVPGLGAADDVLPRDDPEDHHAEDDEHGDEAPDDLGDLLSPLVKEETHTC